MGYLYALLLLISTPDINYYHDSALFIAENHDVDPGIFRAMIYMESSWDTKAQRGDCFGLGQLKESTASEMAGRDITGEMLIDDPILSLEISACYLKYCERIAGGDIIRALSYYRYGPWSGVDRWTPYSKAVVAIYKECYNNNKEN